MKRRPMRTAMKTKVKNRTSLPKIVTNVPSAHAGSKNGTRPIDVKSSTWPNG